MILEGQPCWGMPNIDQISTIRTMVAVTPFMCYLHPNGLHSLRKYPEQLCEDPGAMDTTGTQHEHIDVNRDGYVVIICDHIHRLLHRCFQQASLCLCCMWPAFGLFVPMEFVAFHPGWYTEGTGLGPERKATKRRTAKMVTLRNMQYDSHKDYINDELKNKT